ncbi:hypothetical protein PCANC_05815 [Puccinia coronata f. sp. avenae]|uniref:Uncharacterized protein n=1 Tax=Puccinia coronata f. sp. avenae TaxID=200324 RepID=A0A2N5VST7_9BASI|nr:hypothetical protein PCANC_05815 [Puccinia coronata f. sp. avenae]
MLLSTSQAANVVAPGKWQVPPRRERTPCRAGRRLYQSAEELFLGEQVQAGPCSPRDNFSVSWYKLLPARQRVASRYSLELARCMPVPAHRGITPQRAGTHQLEFDVPNAILERNGDSAIENCPLRVTWSNVPAVTRGKKESARGLNPRPTSARNASPDRWGTQPPLHSHHMQTVDTFGEASSGDMSGQAGRGQARRPRVVNDHREDCGTRDGLGVRCDPMTTHTGTTRTKSPCVAWNRHAASLVPYRSQDAAVSVLASVSVTKVGLRFASTPPGCCATSGGPNRHGFGF